MKFWLAGRTWHNFSSLVNVYAIVIQKIYFTVGIGETGTPC